MKVLPNSRNMKNHELFVETIKDKKSLFQKQSSESLRVSLQNPIPSNGCDPWKLQIDNCLELLRSFVLKLSTQKCDSFLKYPIDVIEKLRKYSSFHNIDKIVANLGGVAIVVDTLLALDRYSSKPKVARFRRNCYAILQSLNQLDNKQTNEFLASNSAFMTMTKRLLRTNDHELLEHISAILFVLTDRVPSSRSELVEVLLEALTEINLKKHQTSALNLASALKNASIDGWKEFQQVGGVEKVFSVIRTAIANEEGRDPKSPGTKLLNKVTGPLKSFRDSFVFWKKAEPETASNRRLIYLLVQLLRHLWMNQRMSTVEEREFLSICSEQVVCQTLVDKLATAKVSRDEEHQTLLKLSSSEHQPFFDTLVECGFRPLLVKLINWAEPKKEEELWTILDRIDGLSRD